MDIIKAIHSRRSIRKYEDRAVPDESIRQIISAGMSAPSAGNQQPWQFIVIKDKNILDKIPTVHRHASFAKNAPLAILICGDLKFDKHKDFWIQDCSAATQNMLLAIHALGLGAVWTGVYPREDRIEAFRKLLNIPHEVIPFAFIPVGYPAQNLPENNRFNEERIHIDKW